MRGPFSVIRARRPASPLRHQKPARPYRAAGQRQRPAAVAEPGCLSDIHGRRHGVRGGDHADRAAGRPPGRRAAAGRIPAADRALRGHRPAGRRPAAAACTHAVSEPAPGLVGRSPQHRHDQFGGHAGRAVPPEHPAADSVAGGGGTAPVQPGRNRRLRPGRPAAAVAAAATGGSPRAPGHRSREFRPGVGRRRELGRALVRRRAPGPASDCRRSPPPAWARTSALNGVAARPASSTPQRSSARPSALPSCC